MAFGGFRLGEALAMRVKHFNFENLTYRVCETLTKAQDFAPAKCSSERTVHLPSFVMDSVEKYVNKRKLTGSDLLFVDSSCPKGLPYTQRKVQYFFSKVCKKAGLKDNSPHVLRHTYATILLMAHQSIDFVRMQLGHSSIKTTVDQYGHWIPAEGRYNLEGALTGVITGAVPPQINEN
jgi:integrase